VKLSVAKLTGATRTLEVAISTIQEANPSTGRRDALPGVSAAPNIQNS